MNAFPGIELTRGVPLSQRTTLRLGGPAVAEALVRSEEGFSSLDELLRQEGAAPLALGAGSNILAADGPLPLVLVRPGNGREPEILGQEHGATRVLVPAALRLPGLLAWAASWGLAGLDGLTGIPGYIGGAVAMNAGSYGSEMGQVLTRVRIWRPGQSLSWIEARDCRLDYRTFDPGIPGFFLVWEAELALRQDQVSAVRERMAAAYIRKKATQPVTAHTCGCVFKNPPGASAGWLLDQCGFKGRTEGGMGFSALHANFLVNLGQGTTAQALTLLDQARRAVAEKFGPILQCEVRMVP